MQRLCASLPQSLEAIVAVADNLVTRQRRAIIAHQLHLLLGGMRLKQSLSLFLVVLGRKTRIFERLRPVERAATEGGVLMMQWGFEHGKTALGKDRAYCILLFALRARTPAVLYRDSHTRAVGERKIALSVDQLP